jgi:dephospho-CoA kinase
MVSKPFSSAIVITGLPCCGKTVGAQILSRRLGRFHYEASDVMRELHVRYKGAPTNLDQFAIYTLELDPTVVPRNILSNAYSREEREIIISGLRSPIELDALAHAVETLFVIYVQAPLQLRYARCLARGRADRQSSLKEFVLRDEIQKRMGIELIRAATGTVITQNETTFEDFDLTLTALATSVARRTIGAN